MSADPRAWQAYESPAVAEADRPVIAERFVQPGCETDGPLLKVGLAQFVELMQKAGIFSVSPAGVTGRQFVKHAQLALDVCGQREFVDVADKHHGLVLATSNSTQVSRGIGIQLPRPVIAHDDQCCHGNNSREVDTYLPIRACSHLAAWQP